MTATADLLVHQQSPPKRYYRKVIRVRAEDSPNVRYALEQIRLGIEPTNEIIVPGVLSYADYKKRRATWGKMRQCIGLDGLFYDGGEIMLFPTAWLDSAEQAARNRPAWDKIRWMGCDPAEGGDWSSWSIIDKYGLLEMHSLRTPDTNVIPLKTIELAERHDIDPVNICFDAGGGGKQHADRLRAMPHRKGSTWKVRTVRFGESVSLDPKRGLNTIDVRIDVKEDKGAFFNRRAEMYGELAELIDPARTITGLGSFALPTELMSYKRGDEERATLRQQLEPIPKSLDAEGKLKLLPKNNPTDPDDPRTLVKLIGHSPDEADGLVLACHGMLHKKVQGRAGVAT